VFPVFLIILGGHLKKSKSGLFAMHTFHSNFDEVDQNLTESQIGTQLIFFFEERKKIKIVTNVLT
jgi:hypothetical protein